MPRSKYEELSTGSSRKRRKDFDPEDDQDDQSDGSDISGAERQQDVGDREHYEIVGKSRLREAERVSLDAKYGGLPIRRSALDNEEDNNENDLLGDMEDDEDEDPFAPKSAAPKRSDDEGYSEGDNVAEQDYEAISEDEEIDSDEAFGESDVERFKNFSFRGSKSNRNTEEDSDLGETSEGEDESDIDMSDESEDSPDTNSVIDEDDMTDEEIEDLDDEEEVKPEKKKQMQPISKQLHKSSTTRDEIRALLANDASAVTHSLTGAVSADVAKGKAVRQQQQTFDRFLDARIKLQKGINATDEIMSLPSETILGSDADAALEEAEAAAFKLFSTIESMRDMILQSAQETTTTAGSIPSKKRKRAEPISSTTSSSYIWTYMQEDELASRQPRRAVLDKWSNKIRASDPTQINSSMQSKLFDRNAGQSQARLSAVLDTYLLSEQDKLVESATTSTGQAQTSDSISSYNDASFYQSLLRDLITSRSANASINSTNIMPLKLHPSGNKAKPNGKIIDTRASKGRKIRYTVHEKLQNFMAAQGDAGRDTSQWTEAAKREFFGSLMGQSRALDEVDSDGDADLDGNNAEGEALRLFRS